MPAKGDRLQMPIDFHAKFLELDGKRDPLAKHFGVSREVSARWIAEARGEIRELEMADIPKGRPSEMLKERDLDPKHFQLQGLRIAEWEVTTRGDDGEPVTSLNRQTRFNVIPRLEQIHPAQGNGWAPPKPKQTKRKAGEPVLILGDHQAPYHDQALHAATLNWLAEVKPAEAVIDGDLVDLPTMSTFSKRNKWNAAVNECTEAAYRILCDYRSASPDTRWTYIFGNHEDRLAKNIYNSNSEFTEIRCAGEETPVFSLPNLMHLDRIGIKWMDNHPHDVLKLSDNTAVIHGNKAKPGSGGTSQHEVKDRRHHIFHGHDHSQAITPFTTYDIDGNVMQFWGVAVGASCQVKGGLGYAVRPDWQNGHATATFDKAGNMTPELLTWTDDKLYWRGDWWK